jgi:hypothetical protein
MEKSIMRLRREATEAALNVAVTTVRKEMWKQVYGRLEFVC